MPGPEFTVARVTVGKIPAASPVCRPAPGKLGAGKLPVTSVARLTAPKVGAPVGLPCKTVLAVPNDPNADMVCEPLPNISALTVAAPGLVVQVGQESVPVVLIGPPESGPDVAMLVTVPLPPGEMAEVVCDVTSPFPFVVTTQT